MMLLKGALKKVLIWVFEKRHVSQRLTPNLKIALLYVQAFVPCIVYITGDI